VGKDRKIGGDGKTIIQKDYSKWMKSAAPFI
jgi:hypothetical protein